MAEQQPPHSPYPAVQVQRPGPAAGHSRFILASFSFSSGARGPGVRVPRGHTHDSSTRSRSAAVPVILLPPPLHRADISSRELINVKNYGAHGNGVNDDTKLLMAAWKAACGSAGAVTMVVTPRTYYIGPVQFHDPCKASTLTFQLQGTLKASTDLKRFGNDWIEFGWVNRGRSNM